MTEKRMGIKEMKQIVDGDPEAQNMIHTLIGCHWGWGRGNDRVIGRPDDPEPCQNQAVKNHRAASTRWRRDPGSVLRQAPRPRTRKLRTPPGKQGDNTIMKRTIITAVLAATAVIGLSSCIASAQTPTGQRWGALVTVGVSDSHESDTPTPISGLSGIVQMAVGNASGIALDSSGNVFAWGLGTHGALGQGDTVNHVAAAVRVPGLPTIVSIGESQDTNFAVSSTGTVYGWGYNAGGQLCLGNTAQHHSPTLLPLSGVTATAGGSDHEIFLTSSGTVEACGGNSNGQLGNGTTTNSTTVVSVTGLTGVTQISAGETTSSAILTSGQVWDWGQNEWGQLGNGTTTNSDVPVQVNLPSGSVATQVYTGGSINTNGQAIAMLSSGVPYIWGNDSFGQFCNGTQSATNSTPVQAFTALPSGVTLSSVATGGYTSYGIDTSGNVWACGSDRLGAVGDGSSKGNVLSPVDVLSGATIVGSTANNVAAYQP
jgi:alpha-tubulin suppressor-like RCC1 family protein